MYLKMGRIMRKNILLSFGLLLTCGLCACSTFSDDSTEQVEIVPVEEAQPVIDATANPGNKCGVDGISCNDTALINYTKTEADYREYGERTKRDHLYTQAAAGNNLTATIRPDYEDDVVTEYEPGSENGDNSVVAVDDFSPQKLDDGVFERTAANDLTPQDDFYPQSDLPSQDNLKPQSSDTPNGTVGHADNVIDTIRGPGYEIVCQEECDDFAKIDDSITSEFTEDSFDIADYIKNNGDEADDDTDTFDFEEVGEKSDVDGDGSSGAIEVAETEITDDSVLTWDAQEGDNLRELLTKWSKKAGWKLLWNTNRNYVLSAGAMFKGKFTDVSSALIRAFARARPAPIATYYKGNRVIVVETMENENAY